MTKTSCKVAFSLSDVTARQDALYESESIQSFVDLSLFNKAGGIVQPKIATLEDDLFWLDGSYELFPDNGRGMENFYWSSEISDADGFFQEAQTMDILFTESHSSVGITFYFNTQTDDYADVIAVTWYDRYGSAIHSGRYEPSGSEYQLEARVQDYYRIKVDFIHTNKPYRFVKISTIEFGVDKVFDEDEIVAANVLEQANPISAEIPINTFSLTLRSEDAEYSPLNPSGVFGYLQTRQAMQVYEYWNDEEIFIGTYYLDKWDDATESILTIKCIDAIGIIDQTRFLGGMYFDVPAGDIVAEIMDSASAEYEIDDSLVNTYLSGHIPICTHREALQQVAIAIGAIVDTSRSNRIRIYKQPVASRGYIPKSNKILGGKVNLKALVTGVLVTSHSFRVSDEEREIVKGDFDAGIHEIVFSNPVYGLDITGGTILQGNVNYAIIQVPAYGEVVIYGYEYIDTQLVAMHGGNASSNVLANDVEIKDATLVSQSNAAEVAARVYAYYQSRYENTFTQLPSKNTPGSFVLVDSLRGERLRGFIESMSINLSGGFLASTSLVGYRIETHYADYAGEFYAGEGMGVI